MSRGQCTIRGLGDGADPNCAVGMPYDVNGDPCPDPNAAVIVSSNSNPYALPGLTPGPVYPSGVVNTGSPVTSGVFSPPSTSPIAVSQFPQSAQLPAGPSPRVAVPLTSSSAGMFLSSGTLLGLPMWEWLALGAAVLILPGLIGGGGRRRRR